jgi:hypothetical protein
LQIQVSITRTHEAQTGLSKLKEQYPEYIYGIHVHQGCQIFLGPNIPKFGINILNDHKLHQTAIKYAKWL